MNQSETANIFVTSFRMTFTKKPFCIVKVLKIQFHISICQTYHLLGGSILHQLIRFGFFWKMRDSVMKYFSQTYTVRCCKDVKLNYKICILYLNWIVEIWKFPMKKYICVGYIVKQSIHFSLIIPALSKESSGILLLPLSVRSSVRPSERKVCHWNSVYILRICEMILQDLIGCVLKIRL